MLSPFRLWIVASCLLALTSLTPVSHAQNVTTWHNDMGRTGWQPNETTLTQANVLQANSFGLLWQWHVTGAVFAQPLAVKLQQRVGTCGSPCSLVLIATEQNMLYAFNAASPSPTPVWSLSLGTPVNCSSLPTGVVDFAPCDGVDGAPPGPQGGVVGPYGGVTGTPVIDMSTINPNTLYVVAPVVTGGDPPISYYLFAVDITTTNHSTVPSIRISGSVAGNPPPDPMHTGKCTSDYPTAGSINFGYNFIQRSGLLLMPNGNVYVAFAPAGHEVLNGWMFGYSFNGSSLTQTAKFSSTPWGTGGGFWGSGAGPASDGIYIYAATGNGTTFDVTASPVDMGDSLLKLNPSDLSRADYYTPRDVFSYPAPPGGQPGRCLNDIDFGSGGVLLPPAQYFKYNQMSVVVNADKESNLYVANQASLGNFNPSGGNNIQTVLTPCFGGPPGCNQNPSTQGYWASPAYWYDGTYSWLYYSPTVDPKIDPTAAPYPVYAYQLATGGSSGPISQSATASTGAPDLFCPFSPTLSVSSNPNALATTGIVWAIEHRNSSTQGCPTKSYGGAALHAFTATKNQGVLTKLYDSAVSLTQTTIRPPTSFSTPTIFQGQVYMGTGTLYMSTTAEVDVFGLCINGPSGQCQP